MASKKPIVINNGQQEQIQSTDVVDIVTLPVDTDGTLTADSDNLIPTQKAVKTYVDANAGGTFDYSQVLFTQLFS